VSKIKRKVLLCTFLVKILSTSLLRVGKLALLGLAFVSACAANPKCANVGWLKLFFKMCGGEIFKTNALA